MFGGPLGGVPNTAGPMSVAAASSSMQSRAPSEAGSDGVSSAATWQMLLPAADQDKRLATGIGGRILTFFCRWCKQTLPVSLMSTGRVNVCQLDNTSYKGLATKWGKQRCLKTMWDTWDETQQATWFRTQQGLEAGSKRKYDDLLFSEVGKNIVDDLEQEQDMYVPWPKFRDAQLMMGVSLPDAEKKWVELVDDPATGAIWRRQQWCIPEFAGIMKAKEVRHSQGFESRRTATVSSADQFQDLHRSAASLLNTFSDSIHRPTQRQSSAPPVLRQILEQATRPEVPDLVANVIQREARVMQPGYPGMFHEKKLRGPDCRVTLPGL